MTDTPRGYGEEALRQILATDPRVLEPELHVEILGDTVVVSGVVPTEERRRAVDEVIAEHTGALGEAMPVDNRTEVASFPPPSSQEHIP